MSFTSADSLGYELRALRANNVWKWDHLYFKGTSI